MCTLGLAHRREEGGRLVGVLLLLRPALRRRQLTAPLHDDEAGGRFFFCGSFPLRPATHVS